MKIIRTVVLLICVWILITGAAARDWPELRGPNRDGNSPEKNLPEKWSPAGENLIWHAPYGSISGPVVLGNRLYLQNTVGEGATLQERLVCLDANSGKMVWENRFNVNHSDVPPQLVGWATPAIDPETGFVFAFTASGRLAAFTREGIALWMRDLTEEFGLLTTENGRTVSPVIDGPLVVVSGITSNWGDHAGTAHRIMAFDKRMGDTVWVSSSENRPYDTAYSPPLVTEIDGVRLLVSGGSDGAWHGIKISTGERVWRYEVSKRGINAGAIRIGQDLILSHGEENVEGNTTGFMAALNTNASGQVRSNQTKWLKTGFAAGFSSPVTDGQRIYRIDNGGLLAAFNAATGEQVWTQKLGAIQKASPVFADGKLYVGSEDGKFFILRPRADGCDILSQVTLGTADKPERVTSSAAVSDGRVYLASSQTIYAIGAAGTRASVPAPIPPLATPGAQDRAPASVQVIPAEVALYPGQPVKFLVKLFDAKGNFIRDVAATPPQPPTDQQGRGGRGGQPSQQGQPVAQQPPTQPPAQPAPQQEPAQQGRGGRGGQPPQQGQAQQLPPQSELQWSVEQLAGTVAPDGTYTPPPDGKAYAGKVKVKAGNLTGEARVRVIPAQWQTTFDDFEAGSSPAWWLNGRNKFAVKEVGGNKVLSKLADDQSAFNRRARTYGGLRTASNYAIQADVRFAAGRPAIGDGGIVGQGYELVLSGNGQLQLQSWQPETKRTMTAPMPVNADTWYHLKLQVETLTDGSVRARGKAWRGNEQEPQNWTLERTDKLAFANLTGSPGLYGDARAEVYFDNLKVIPNR